MNKLLKELHEAGCNLVLTKNIPEEGEPFDLMGGLCPVAFRIHGTFGHNFRLVISHIKGDNEDAIKKIIAAVTAAMNAGPILRSSKDILEDVVGIGSLLGYSRGLLENVAYDTWIWDLLNPDAYLRRILNDIRSSEYDEYLQAEFFGGRSAADYLDPALQARYRKAQEAHKNYDGIYGLDPVTLDVPELEDASTLEIFLFYIGQTLEESGSIDDQLETDYLKYFICQREHIHTSAPSSEQRLVVSDEFKAWEEFYLRHIREVLSSEQREALYNASIRDEDLSKFAPQGDWRKSSK